MRQKETKLGLLSVQFFLVHVLLPIVVGGLIYTFWRKPTLLVFSWYDFVGLNELVACVRNGAQSLYSSLPAWFLFCLPDGLWVYSMTTFMAGLWVNTPKPYLLFWVSLAPIMAIGGELGQFLGFVQGTFDTTDILFYFAGLIIAISVVFEKNKRTTHEKHCLA